MADILADSYSFLRDMFGSYFIFPTALAVIAGLLVKNQISFKYKLIAIITTIPIILATFFMFFYQYPPGPGEKKWLIAGTTLTPQAKAYIALDTGTLHSKADLVYKFGGDPTQVWTNSSIKLVHIWLSTICLFAVFCISAATQKPK